MHTRHIKTSSGQIVVPSDVSSAGWMGTTGIRVSMRGGEVVTDHWATPGAARLWMIELDHGMAGLEFRRADWTLVEDQPVRVEDQA